MLIDPRDQLGIDHGTPRANYYSSNELLARRLIIVGATGHSKQRAMIVCSMTPFPQRPISGCSKRWVSDAATIFDGAIEGLLSFASVMSPVRSSPPSDRHVAGLALLFVVGVLPPHHAIRGASVRSETALRSRLF
jgi:hypothetical protein